MSEQQTGIAFSFKRNDHIGEAEAEFDEEFLSNCFVSNGALEVLRDCSAAQRIIVGRTGSGKSALIKMLHEVEANVIKILPDQLSLAYLSNSSVIRFFEDAGANLDVFYQLLWRHVLVVELLKYKYNILNENSQKSFLDKINLLISKDKAKQKAIDYLRKWGENFWNETEYRVKDVTTKLENELKASLTTDSIIAKLNTGASSKLSTEEKLEVVQRGANVVSKVQIKELSDVLKLLSEEIFNDPQINHYITIDDLDTKWTDDNLKYKLIRALIETIKNFRQVKYVKIIISLRVDLLQKVIEATRDSGFQSEKYESLQLKLTWSANDIYNIVNKRISYLVKQRYTSRSVGIEDLFPAKIANITFKDYLTQLTFLRPRDAILFVNECLSKSASRGQISVQIVLDSEGGYAQKRLNSLAEEWSTIYPLIINYLKIFSGKSPTYKISEMTAGEIESWAYNEILQKSDEKDPVLAAATKHFLLDEIRYDEFLKTLIKAMYTTGAIGVKINTTLPEQWSYFSDQTLVESALSQESTVSLHTLFWRPLGVNLNNKRSY